jgi:hypothetical protein
MATQTENYGLMKPTANEYYDVDVTNGNMDIIDAELKKRENEATEIVTTLSQHKSIFAAGTGKDSGNIEQDFHSKVEGQSNVKIEGSTAVNAVKNGDFSSADWGANLCTYTVLNNEAICTVSTGGIVTGIYRSLTAQSVVGHKYYHAISIYPKHLGEMRIGYLNNNSVLTPTVANAWNKLTGVMTAVSASNSFILYHDTSLYASGETWKYKEAMCIDLTSLFGAGNEPTKEQCDFMYDHYINGMQGVGSGRVNCLGKNICGSRWLAEQAVALLNDPNYCYLSNVDGRNVLVLRGNINHNGVAIFNKFKPNTQYTVSYYGRLLDLVGVGAEYLSFYYTDGTATLFTAGYDLIWNYYSFTSIAGKTVKSIIISLADSGSMCYDYDTFQIEEGVTATEYEPFKSSGLATTMPTGMQLHRLPNGIYDNIEEDMNNTRTLIKRTAEYTLKASDITILRTDPTAIDYLLITLPSDCVLRKTENSGAIMTNFSVPANYTYADAVSSIGKHFYGTTSYSLEYVIVFVVAKGIYANLAAAQTALAGTKVVYELATPKVYANGANGFYQEGNLEVYEDGVIYQESSVNSKEYNNAKLHITYNLSDKAIEMSNSEGITNINKRIKGRLKNSLYCIESGNYANALGVNITASGEAATAEGGGGGVASGNYSHVGGWGSIVSGVQAFAHGLFLRAVAQAQAVFGRYNVPSATDLFQVGNGTSDANRKNAVVVDNFGRFIANAGILNYPMIYSGSTVDADAEVDLLLNNYAAGVGYNCKYSFLLSLSFVYTGFGTGGDWLIEGFVINDSFEWQTATIYNSGGLLMKVRSKISGGWTPWINKIF